MTDFDDDDWQDLEKPAAGEQKPDASVRLSLTGGRHGAGEKVRAHIVLRRGAADWIRSNGPRFRVQIGGANANGVRIVADAARGQYEAAELKGVMRLSIGVVTAWPNEAREPAEANWKVTGGGACPNPTGGIREGRQGFPRHGKGAPGRREGGAHATRHCRAVRGEASLAAPSVARGQCPRCPQTRLAAEAPRRRLRAYGRSAARPIGAGAA
jgi:hypothetical protein